MEQSVTTKETKGLILQLLDDFHVGAGTSIRRNLLEVNILKKGKQFTQKSVWSALNELCYEGILEVDKYDSGVMKRIK
jgi:hypothetical protein